MLLILLLLLLVRKKLYPPPTLPLTITPPTLAPLSDSATPPCTKKSAAPAALEPGLTRSLLSMLRSRDPARLRLGESRGLHEVRRTRGGLRTPSPPITRPSEPCLGSGGCDLPLSLSLSLSLLLLLLPARGVSLEEEGGDA